MKRVLSVLLVIVMISTIPGLTFTHEVKAISYITNPSKASGSDYTNSTKLAAMLNAVFAGDIDIYTNSACTTEVSMPIGSRMSMNTQYYVKSKTTGNNCSGWQCYIYANAVYNKLFNEWVGHGSSFSHSKVVISGGANRASYEMFKNAGVRCGAYMRTTTKKDGSYYGDGGHSLIILSYNSSSLTYIEGNGDGNGLVDIRTVTWDEFYQYTLGGKGRYISHVVQPTDEYYEKIYPSCICEKYSSLGVCENCGMVFNWESQFDPSITGIYKILEDFTPRTDAPYDAATKADVKLKKGDTVEVIGTYINAHENLWYMFTYDNAKIGYVYYPYLVFSAPNKLNVTCTGFTPENNTELPTGYGYPVWGSVKSNNPLKTVVASLNGTPYATWTAPNNTTMGFEINPTDINQNLKFGTLSAGRYTISLLATDIYGQTQTFLVNTFQMVSQSCSHTYDSKIYADPDNHWKVCTKCGFEASIEEHIYTDVCDSNCNTCGYSRSVSHMYDGTYVGNESGHWLECVNCGVSSKVVDHTYTFDCDKECDECGYERNADHELYSNYSVDEDGHWRVCSICDEKLNYGSHIPGEEPTETTPQLCTECGYMIAGPKGHEHNYESNYSSDSQHHWYECSSLDCTSKSDVEEHIFDNPCNSACSQCGYKLSREHVYTNDCDVTCNRCFEIRATDHKYSEGIIISEATTTTTGEKLYICTVCGFEKRVMMNMLDEDTHPSTGGCYIATCVYGSYDCPEVWTLRRFRDDTLGSTWYGRLFIDTYYAISPTLVEWFGETEWFQNIWKGILDWLVDTLNDSGVEDTPYNDIEWQ